VRADAMRCDGGQPSEMLRRAARRFCAREDGACEDGWTAGSASTQQRLQFGDESAARQYVVDARVARTADRVGVDVRDKSDDFSAGSLLPFNGGVDRAALIEIDDEPPVRVFGRKHRRIAKLLDLDADGLRGNADTAGEDQIADENEHGRERKARSKIKRTDPLNVRPLNHTAEFA